MRTFVSAMLVSAAFAAENSTSIGDTLSGLFDQAKNAISALQLQLATKAQFQDWLAGRNNATAPADLQMSSTNLPGVAAVEPAQPGHNATFHFDYTPTGEWGAYRVQFNLWGGANSWAAVNGFAMNFQMKSQKKATTASRLLQTTNTTTNTTKTNTTSNTTTSTTTTAPVVPAQYEGFIGWWQVPAAVGEGQNLVKLTNWLNGSVDHNTDTLKWNNADNIGNTETVTAAITYYGAAPQAALRKYSDKALSFTFSKDMAEDDIKGNGFDLSLSTRVATWTAAGTGTARKITDGAAAGWASTASTVASSISFTPLAKSAIALAGAAVATTAMVTLF